MAELIEIEVSGIEETCAMLDGAPPAIVKAAFARALTAAAVPVADELRYKCPILADGSVHHDPPPGALKAHVITDIALDANGRGGVAEIGFGKLGYVARLVEFGHRLVGHKPKNKDLGNVVAHPFMRPVAVSTADEAVEEFRKGLEEGFREGIPGVKTA